MLSHRMRSTSPRGDFQHTVWGVGVECALSALGSIDSMLKATYTVKEAVQVGAGVPAERNVGAFSLTPFTTYP